MQSITNVSKSVNCETTGNTRIQEIEFFAKLGAAYVPVVGKNPIKQNWQHNPYTAKQIAKHAGNIGILLGKPSNGIICVDADANAQTLIEKYPLLQNTLQVYRKDAPDRCKFFFRVIDQLPKSAVYTKKGELRPSLEILATGRQAVVIGTHVDGCAYENNGAEILAVKFDDLSRLWALITGDEIAPPNGIVNKNVNKGEHENTLGAYVNSHVSCMDIVKHFELDQDGTKLERNGELRIFSNGGLLVNEAKGLWRNYTHWVGGDAISLYAYITRGKHETEGSEFVDVCKEIAAIAGFELPEYKRDLGFDPDAALEWAANPHTYPLGRNNPFDRAVMVAMIQLMIETRKPIVKLSVRDAAERVGTTPATAGKALRRLTGYKFIEVVDSDGNYLDVDSQIDEFVGGRLEARSYRLSKELTGKLNTLKQQAGVLRTVSSTCPISTTDYIRYSSHDIFNYGAKIDGTDKGTAKIGLDVICTLSKENDLTSAEIGERIGRTQEACADVLGVLTMLGVVERYREGRSILYHLVDGWEDILEKISSGVNTYGNTIKRKINHLCDRINMAKRYLSYAISVKLANNLSELIKKWGKKRSMLLDEFNRLMEIKAMIFAN